MVIYKNSQMNINFWKKIDFFFVILNYNNFILLFYVRKHALFIFIDFYINVNKKYIVGYEYLNTIKNFNNLL